MAIHSLSGQPIHFQGNPFTFRATHSLSGQSIHFQGNPFTFRAIHSLSGQSIHFQGNPFTFRAIHSLSGQSIPFQGTFRAIHSLSGQSIPFQGNPFTFRAIHSLSGQSIHFQISCITWCNTTTHLLYISNISCFTQGIPNPLQQWSTFLHFLGIMQACACLTVIHLPRSSAVHNKWKSLFSIIVNVSKFPECIFSY
jgi:hypothetical protein